MSWKLKNVVTFLKITICFLLSRPLLFNQSATNAESLALNASKFVSAMIYQPTWKRNMKSRLPIKFPTPMSGDQMPRPRED